LATTSPQLDDPGVRERVLEIVRGLLEELGSHGAIAELSEKSNLDRDLGLGSLERVELLARIENALGVRLPDSIAAEATTPQDLIESVLRAPGSPAADAEELSGLRAAITANRRAEDAAESVVQKAETLIEVIRQRGIHDASRTHLIISEDMDGAEHQHTMTFGDLYAAAQKCAEELARRGVPAGGRVSLMLPTSREFFICYAVSGRSH